jgi:hypothetical protein
VFTTPRAAAGAPSARHSLRPLFEGEWLPHNSGASHRGIECVRVFGCLEIAGKHRGSVVQSVALLEL